VAGNFPLIVCSTNSDLRIATPGHEVLVERGEHINLNFGYRFTAEALHALLAERGGLRVLEKIPSDDGRYMLVVCSR
jgi:hypothetical protein